MHRNLIALSSSALFYNTQITAIGMLYLQLFADFIILWVWTELIFLIVKSNEMFSQDK